ncbi:MAG: tetratricopeptide repeat protein [Waterburya sp.]
MLSSSSLYELLQYCTVKLTSAESETSGTGFFVAKGKIITCAHVVEKYQTQTISVIWQGKEWATAKVESILPDPIDLALLQVELPEGEHPPCVLLDKQFDPFDSLYVYGYPDDFPAGGSVTIDVEGTVKDRGVTLIKAKQGQVRPGHSGSPALNKKTSRVCGIVSETRHRSSDLGGLLIPVSMVFRQFSELCTQNQEIHDQDRRWLESVLPDRFVSFRNTPSNLKTGSANFVGRKKQLEELHQLLQTNKQLSISGMGGIGKTELALQYAHAYQNHYPGGLCWFPVKSENLVSQIIGFARTYLDISVPDELETDLDKVNYCWHNWSVEVSLIILDDLINYGNFYREQIKPYLPPATSKIKVLMTSREKPVNIPRIDLDVLSEDSAIELLTSFIGDARVEAELKIAKDLCKWLGYLPLGLELVGSYMALDEILKVEKTLKRLEKRKLEAPIISSLEQADVNAQIGVAKAFDLSWSVLTPEAQKLGCYLGLFTSEPFKWSWVESVWITPSDEEEREEQIEDLERLRNLQLTKRSLLTSVKDSHESTEYNYLLHSLIAEYFQSKLKEQEQVIELKHKFCGMMIQIAQSISQNPNIYELKEVATAIPHLSSVATDLIEYVDSKNIVDLYRGLSRFYVGQGTYYQGERWAMQGLTLCIEEFGEKNLDVASSRNDLAFVYYLQGKYFKAENLFLKALEFREDKLGEQDLAVAITRNDLALNYIAQKKYNDAEPLLKQALDIHIGKLGNNHQDVATIKNNLAELYLHQGKPYDAEPLLKEALDVFREEGEKNDHHPHVSLCLNNLGGACSDQRKYSDAESYYLEALNLRRDKLGIEHPYVALTLNKLGNLYLLQRRYEDAEHHFQQALEICQKRLDEQHPYLNTSLNNLAKLCCNRKRYSDAKSYYLRALAISEKKWGKNHSKTNIIRDSLNFVIDMEQKY